jgi:membrane-associated phospholipid phosphatase
MRHRRNPTTPSASGCCTAAGNSSNCCRRLPAIDRWVHDRARDAYARRVELLQRPLEIAGLPGVYIPLAFVIARRMRRARIAGGRAIWSAALAAWLALRATRFVYDRKRPPRPPHRGPKSESSYPSGHTTGITALAVAAAAVLEEEGVLSPSAARALAIGAPLVMGLNRAYVREHWATDVLGGWLLGTAVALGCVGLRERRPGRVAARSRA